MSPAFSRGVTARTDAVRCHRCGYLLDGVPQLGKAVLCPECSGINSFDPELHAKLQGDYGVAATFHGANRRVVLIAILTGSAAIVWGVLDRYWPIGLAGGVLIAGAWIVRWRRPRWFTPEPR